MAALRNVGVVVTDYHMPGRDGLQFADDFHRIHPDVPVILVTTDASGALEAAVRRRPRTMLQRNHIEPPRSALAFLKNMQHDAEHAAAPEELLGIEGSAARVYFQHFAGMIKLDEPGTSSARAPEFTFDFNQRNRRPPRDPVNALLSLAYSVLSKDLTIVCHTVGFDPFLGFYHQPRFGRASLALDLMEPFRPLIADSAVLSAISTAS